LSFYPLDYVPKIENKRRNENYEVIEESNTFIIYKMNAVLQNPDSASLLSLGRLVTARDYFQVRLV